MFLAAHYPGEVGALCVRHRATNTHVDELRIAGDGIQRCSQLVAYRGQEIVLGAITGQRFGRLSAQRDTGSLELARPRRQLRVGARQLDAGGLALGNVLDGQQNERWPVAL